MRRVVTASLAVLLAACGGEETQHPARPSAAPVQLSSDATRTRQGARLEGPESDAARLAALVDDLRSDDESVADAAVRDLRAAGDAAVPALLARYFDADFLWGEEDTIVRLLVERRDAAIPDVLAAFDSGLHTERFGKPLLLLQWIGASGGFGDRAPLVVDTLLRHTDDDHAIRLIGSCGAAAERAVPELARVLTQRPDSGAPLAVFAALGPRAKAALPDLLALLDPATLPKPTGDDSGFAASSRRCSAIETIACLGPEARVALSRVSAIASGGAVRERRCAIDALGEIGVADDAVVAALTAAVRFDDLNSVVVAIGSMQRLGLRGPEVNAALAHVVLASSSPASASAARWLATLAEHDASAAATAAELLARSEWDHGTWAMNSAVREQGGREAVIANLVERVRSAESGSRAAILSALVSLEAPAARSAALGVLPSAAGEERLWAICALAKGGAPDVATLRALSEAAKSRDPAVAREALAALAKLGTAASSAAPSVLSWTDDAELRDEALETLAYLGVRDERIVPSAVARLGSVGWHDRIAAVNTLVAAGPAGHAEMPRIAAMLSDDSLQHWEAGEVLEALAKLGAIEPLLDVLRQDRPAAGWARHAFETVPKSEFDAVAGFAADDSPAVRSVVASWIGESGCEKSESLLIRMLADDDAIVRAAASTALGKLPKLAPATVESLRSAAVDDLPQVRIAACRALAPYDASAAAEAVFKLFELARERYSDDVGAGDALVEMGADARAVAPRFVEFLRPLLVASNARHAMRALHSFPTEARTATPELAGLVTRRVVSTEPGIAQADVIAVRVEAAELLGDFGGPGAADALREALFDPSREVREAAKAALAKLGGR